MFDLPFIESLKIQTSISFPKNTIHINAGGAEQRIVPHQSPIREFNLSKKSLTPAEVDAVRDLFDVVKGTKDPFLYVDKSDYSATSQARTLLGDTWTQGIVVEANGEYLLTKKYVCGGAVHYRPIYAADNLRIFEESGTEVFGWTFEYGGKINGLGGGAKAASFNFKNLVRFKDSDINAIIQTKKMYPLYSMSLVLVEEPFELPFPLTDTFVDNPGHLFAIDFLFQSTFTHGYNNQIKELNSGFNVIQEYQDQPIVEVTFGERTALEQLDIEYMQAFWLCVKGSGAFWFFRDERDTTIAASFRDNTLGYVMQSPLSTSLDDPFPFSPTYSVSPLTSRLFPDGIQVPSGPAGGWGGSVLTLCDCVAIEDAETYTTTHDRPVVIGGATYTPFEAIGLKAMEKSSNLDPNNVELRGRQASIDQIKIMGNALSSVIIKTMKGVSWRVPPASVDAHPDQWKQIGGVGEITIEGQTTWVMQEQSLVERKLAQSPNKITAPTCYHGFCDQGCKLNIASYTYPFAVIGSVSSQVNFTVNTAENFNYGTVTFDDGENAGVTYAISEGVGGNIFLAEIPEGLIEVGAVVTLIKGCEKTIQACREYNNVINFLGLPPENEWVPGNDKYQAPAIIR